MNIKNKYKLFLFSILFLCLSCFNEGNQKAGIIDVDPVFEFQSVDDLYQFFTFENERFPLISAHRGGPYPGYPENAIETFSHIATKMPAIIECDVRITKDSVLVLMHDETLDRTTSGKGKLANMDFSEIKDLFLVDNNGDPTMYQIPTLEDALNWGKRRVIYTLDVKKNVPYDLVINAVRKTQTEAHVVIITYNTHQARLINRLAPDLMISASIKNQDDLIRLTDNDIPDNRIVAFVGTSEPDSALYDMLQKHGIKSILGTIGNLDKRASRAGDQVYADFIHRGADFLSTDRPIEAYKTVKYYIENHKLSSRFIKSQ